MASLSTRQVKTFIRTVEGNTYEYPDQDKPRKNPQVWAVSMTLQCVEEDTGDYSFKRYSTQKTIFVERDTLENAGLMQVFDGREIPEEKKITVEDLILQLLEHVGVYPAG